MKRAEFVGLIRLTLIVLTVGLWLAAAPWSKTIAQEPPPRPNPPPDVPGAPPGRTQPPQSGGPKGGNGRADHGDGVYSFNPCFNIHGLVINWGYRNEPQHPVILSGPGWQTQKTTDDNGYYASDCLGIGLALVNATIPPGLNPLTTDVAVRLGYKPSYEVNLGLYSGQIAPALHLPTMVVSQQSVAPGQILTYTIQAANNAALDEVIITDWLPETLTPVSVSSNQGQYEIWDNLVTADIGQVTAGQMVTITIAASVQADIPPGGVITNRASQLTKGQLTVQTPPVSVEVTAAQSPTVASDKTGKGDMFEPPDTLPVTGAENPE
jgi:uncharacterized repeat protein (TIGR01451 family)